MGYVWLRWLFPTTLCKLAAATFSAAVGRETHVTLSNPRRLGALEAAGARSEGISSRARVRASARATIVFTRQPSRARAPRRTRERPAMIELRPYQHEGIAACRDAMRRRAGCCTWRPTGSGKTVLFAFIAASVATKGKRAIILVHRRELVRQTAEKLAGVRHRLRLHRRRQGRQPQPPITVAAVQTLCVRPTLVLEYDLVVIDEAHHAVAGTWRKVLERLPTRGCSASPPRPSAWTARACAMCSTSWCPAPRSRSWSPMVSGAVRLLRPAGRRERPALAAARSVATTASRPPPS